MKIKFHKYQGTGNDFIILDNRNGEYNELGHDLINKLCDRHFGIGADGLMMLKKNTSYDFEMQYFNADGKPGSMCGNGGRCMVKYVKEIEEHSSHVVLNTGSPHIVKFANDVENIDVVETGREIRYSKRFMPDGINVNFVEGTGEDSIFVRTYERGVEDETLSCGTGVTAAALVSAHNPRGFNRVDVKTTGGNLSVEFTKIDDSHYENIWLCGPAEFVFEGEIDIN